jgi:hypothetical protein
MQLMDSDACFSQSKKITPAALVSSCRRPRPPRLAGTMPSLVPVKCLCRRTARGTKCSMIYSAPSSFFLDGESSFCGSRRCTAVATTKPQLPRLEGDRDQKTQRAPLGRAHIYVGSSHGIESLRPGRLVSFPLQPPPQRETDPLRSTIMADQGTRERKPSSSHHQGNES